ncbi:MAG: histidine kinase, partial [Eubacteriales bacterium]|nr:histidine kinase [Eubacteriales bacterium]
MVWYSNDHEHTESVFTVWLPIYSITADRQLLAALSVDIPSSFFYENCRIAFNEGESIHLVSAGQEMELPGLGKTISIGTDDPSPKLPEEILASLPENNSGFWHADSGESLYLDARFTSSGLNWHMVKAAPYTSIYGNTKKQLSFLIGTFFCGIAMAILLNSIALTRLTMPLKKATKYLSRKKQSDAKLSSFRLTEFLSYRQNDELKMLFSSLQEMMDSIQQHTIRQYRLELLQQETELKMLQAQINPHFIHNTLQCLATNALSKNDVEQYDYLSALGQIMHYAMDISQCPSTLGEELAYISRYFMLQKMRFNSDTILQTVNDYPNGFLLPRMTLQPIIENSIIHGNLMKKPGGLIQVAFETKEQTLILSVRDNGTPVSEERTRELMNSFSQQKEWLSRRNVGVSDLDSRCLLSDTWTQSSPASSRIGLNNVYMRLLLYFGPDCTVSIQPNNLGGTTIAFILPVTPKQTDKDDLRRKTDEDLDCR